MVTGESNFIGAIGNVILVNETAEGCGADRSFGLSVNRGARPVSGWDRDRIVAVRHRCSSGLGNGGRREERNRWQLAECELKDKGSDHL